jgi:hypothetical protein
VTIANAPLEGQDGEDSIGDLGEASRTISENQKFLGGRDNRPKSSARALGSLHRSLAVAGLLSLHFEPTHTPRIDGGLGTYQLQRFMCTSRNFSHRP